ncbi:hypothetical protein [Bradyrhizobium cenepequi]|uniref:hypothetical protein n=1 Tax=Bradyrhizobium cenepequi TaxID=2821403 RepID=UPI001CE2551C|nr:hypothetical protein [Bradyrhizobium cenepequi]MCA6111331.1 hypothetical protein [Bradyrhizobium cenepequi]
MRAARFCADPSHSADVQLPVIVTFATATVCSVADVTNIKPGTRALQLFRSEIQNSRRIRPPSAWPGSCNVISRKDVAIVMTVVFLEEPINFGDPPDEIDAFAAARGDCLPAPSGANRLHLWVSGRRCDERRVITERGLREAASQAGWYPHSRQWQTAISDASGASASRSTP